MENSKNISYPPLNIGGTSNIICKILSTFSIVTDIPESNITEYLDVLLYFKIMTPLKSIINCSSNSIRFPFTNTSISLRPLMWSWKEKKALQYFSISLKTLKLAQLCYKRFMPMTRFIQKENNGNGALTAQPYCPSIRRKIADEENRTKKQVLYFVS